MQHSAPSASPTPFDHSVPLFVPLCQLNWPPIQLYTDPLCTCLFPLNPHAFALSCTIVDRLCSKGESLWHSNLGATTARGLLLDALLLSRSWAPSPFSFCCAPASRMPLLKGPIPRPIFPAKVGS